MGLIARAVKKAVYLCDHKKKNQGNFLASSLAFVGLMFFLEKMFYFTVLVFNFARARFT